jgi:tRNA (guanine6-N2)-methyltransferase
MNFIAFTVKGLEKIAADEIKEIIYDAQILEIQDKRVVFSSNTSYEKMTLLRTVDDVGILALKNTNVTTIQDIYAVQKQFEGFRKISVGTFSFTVSMANVKDLKTSEVEEAVIDLISQKYGWKTIEKDHTNFDIRLFIDKNILYISIRLTAHSLQHRSYKVESQEGSLRPTVAAAMVRLATKDESTLKVVDNFCGSGTILCEALLSNQDIYGGDIDPDAVAITNLNLSHISSLPVERIKIQSATNTKWPNDYFDVAISNLPWDKQIVVNSITDLYSGTLQEYKRIMKENSTICVLVSKPELFIKHAKAAFPRATIEATKISFTGQSPTIVLLTNSGYNDSYDLL